MLLIQIKNTKKKKFQKISFTLIFEHLSDLKNQNLKKM